MYQVHRYPGYRGFKASRKTIQAGHSIIMVIAIPLQHVHESSEGSSSITNPKPREAIPVPAHDQACLYHAFAKAMYMYMKLFRIHVCID